MSDEWPFGEPIFVRDSKKYKFLNKIKKHKRIFATIIIAAIFGPISTIVIAVYIGEINSDAIQSLEGKLVSKTGESKLILDIISLSNNKELQQDEVYIINSTSEIFDETFRINLFNEGKGPAEDTEVSMYFEPAGPFSELIVVEKCNMGNCFNSDHPAVISLLNPNDVISLEVKWRFYLIITEVYEGDFKLIVNVTNPKSNQTITKIHQVEVVKNRPLSSFGATLELDQKVYTWTDKVYITIVHPAANLDPRVIDTIGLHKEDKKMLIYTDSGNELQYGAIETGYDTGIFTATIILSGFPGLDANNDGKFDATGLTFGRYFDGGFIGVEREDGLNLLYNYERDEQNEQVVGSSLITMSIGEIMFDKSNYFSNDNATIRVVDPDLNTNPEKIDFVIIRVESETFPDGMDVSLLETNVATGIFEGIISFSSEEKLSNNILPVSLGDKITAVYFEKTPPVPFHSDEFQPIDLQAIAYILGN